MKKKILCFDIDGVICNTKKNDYSNSKPKKKIINQINKYYEDKYIIKIFTARYMGRNNENIRKAKKMGYDLTYKQLKRWGLKFHKLIMGKPSFDIMIDDKCFNIKDNWKKLIR